MNYPNYPKPGTALRWSAFGWHWQLERDCADYAANAWLKAFQTEEPDIMFVVAEKQPKLPKNLPANPVVR